MSERACVRCGEPLVAGACPRGHPQRAARRQGPRRRWPAVLVLAALAAGGGAYAGLVWYPQRAAADLARPLSGSFAAGREALDAAIAGFPAEGTPESLSLAGEVLAATDAARRALVEAQIDLEQTPAVTIPLVSSRDPLVLANATRDRLEAYYPEALELVGDLEAAARYLSELGPILPSLDNLRAALGGSLEQVVAAARPITDQLLADVRTLAPPDELAAVNASLFGFARGIRGSIDELERVGGGPSPVVTALIEDILSQLDTFQQTALSAPAEARAAGLDQRVADVTQRSDRIVADLRALADQGVEGVTIPG